MVDDVKKKQVRSRHASLTRKVPKSRENFAFASLDRHQSHGCRQQDTKAGHSSGKQRSLMPGNL